MPLYRRLPKRGFNNIFAQELQRRVARPHPDGDRRRASSTPRQTVDAAALIAAGVIRRAKDGVRLLADGELKAKLSFDVAGASKAAIETVEKAGGSVKLPQAGGRRIGAFRQAAAAMAAACNLALPKPISWLRLTRAAR